MRVILLRRLYVMDLRILSRPRYVRGEMLRHVVVSRSTVLLSRRLRVLRIIRVDLSGLRRRMVVFLRVRMFSLMMSLRYRWRPI